MQCNCLTRQLEVYFAQPFLKPDVLVQGISDMTLLDFLERGNMHCVFDHF